MAKNPSIDVQFQIRENSMEMSEFLSGLQDWQDEVCEKDRALKKGLTSVTQAPAAELPAVRGRAKNTAVAKQAKQNAKQAELQQQKKKKKDEEEKKKREAAHAAGHTYDYFKDKWDKFDVDAALKEVDEQEEEEAKQPKRKSGGGGNKSAPRGPGDIASDQVLCEVEDEEEEEEKDPEEEKNLGNECYKKGDYGGAIGHYSESIRIKPSAVAHANRAQALLKQGQFNQAEEDCNSALGLDSGYVKALNRRGTARRHLEKFLESCEDFEMAIRLEPSSTLHQRERSQSASLLESSEKLTLSQPRFVLKLQVTRVERESEPAEDEDEEVEDVGISRDCTPPTGTTKEAEHKYSGEGKGSQSGGEVAPKKGSQDEGNNAATQEEGGGGGRESDPPKPSTSSLSPADITKMAEKAAAKMEAKQAEKVLSAPLPLPKSCLEFERTWKSIQADRQAQARFLKSLPTSKLAGIFKDSLSAAVLKWVLESALTLVPLQDVQEDKDILLGVLKGLSQVPRFSMTLMFLSTKEKQALSPLWDSVISSTQTSSVTEDIIALRKTYKM